MHRSTAPSDTDVKWFIEFFYCIIFHYILLLLSASLLAWLFFPSSNSFPLFLSKPFLPKAAPFPLAMTNSASAVLPALQPHSSPKFTVLYWCSEKSTSLAHQLHSSVLTAEPGLSSCGVGDCFDQHCISVASIDWWDVPKADRHHQRSCAQANPITRSPLTHCRSLSPDLPSEWRERELVVPCKPNCSMIVSS